jgi:hypothetical protein
MVESVGGCTRSRMAFIFMDGVSEETERAKHCIIMFVIVSIFGVEYFVNTNNF